MNETTTTGIPIEDCGTCGFRHPVTRRRMTTNPTNPVSEECAP